MSGTQHTDADRLREQVRDRYASAARQATAGTQASDCGCGATNVDFLEGHIERIPLPAETVDVVVSNCVINLSANKPAVFTEMHRVLVPGGRIRISDVVAEDHLSPADRAERGDWVGCIAGALARTEYEQGLAAAGFEQVSVAFTHQVADGLHGAIIKAVKPVPVDTPRQRSEESRPVV